MKKLLLIFVILPCVSVLSQQNELESDSISQKESVLSVNKKGLLNNININLDLRTDFLTHFEDNDEWNSDFTEFRQRHVALQISGKISDKIQFRFRNRFNRESGLQSLDYLDGSIELAYMTFKLSPKTDIQIGKMFAYFGGFEYEFNPIYVLEYNDIQDNLLNYVTGVGLTHQLTDNHQFGFQALNSRTKHFIDAYGETVSEEVEVPKWPLALVVNWNGSFFGGKLETLYSFSNFRVAKGKGTTNAITLGHRYKEGKLSLMYDFNYSKEELDTKGVVSDIIGGDILSLDASYMEHWIRAEYEFSPKFTGLLTLMTSYAYKKDAYGPDTGSGHLRTSYGIIPTLYYKPFDDYDIRFYLGFIGRSFRYSDYAQKNLGMENLNTGEIRIGLIAPLWIL